jgi:hypothetical protein
MRRHSASLTVRSFAFVGSRRVFRLIWNLPLRDLPHWIGCWRSSLINAVFRPTGKSADRRTFRLQWAKPRTEAPLHCAMVGSFISREREHQVTPQPFEHGEQARHAGDSPL